MDKKELEEALTASQNKIAELEAENNEQKEIIAELRKKLKDTSEVAKTAPKEVIVSSGNKKYKVVIPFFNHNGASLTAADLKNNQALVDELVEMGSGVLSEA